MKIKRACFEKIVFILFVFVIVIPGSCTSSSGKDKPAADTTSENRKPETHTVLIKQMKFFPDELNVRKGDKVVFVNRDFVIHDVTEETKKTWSSSPLATDQMWVLIVTESVDYICSIHPVMKGRIVIE
jgi:plastocyanin